MASLIVAQNPRAELANWSVILKTLPLSIVADFALDCILQEQADPLVKLVRGAIISTGIGISLRDKGVEHYNLMKSMQKATFTPNNNLEIAKILSCALIIGIKVYQITEPLLRNIFPSYISIPLTAVFTFVTVAAYSLTLANSFAFNQQSIFAEGMNYIGQHKPNILAGQNEKIQTLIQMAKHFGWPNIKELSAIYNSVFREQQLMERRY